MSIQVTAIVPCFETGALLLRAIDSLRAQTLPAAEILVIDDGSAGADTLAALKRAAQMPTVTVTRVEANHGVANARNMGLDAASGDYAVFLDADDMFTTTSLEAFVATLRRASGQCDFAYPTVTCFGNRTDTFAPPPFNAYLLHHVNIVPIASMVTRRAIDTGVRFDTAIDVGHEDWDYWLRLVDAGLEGHSCPDATLLYRRVGFTRMDLGNELEGGFDRVLRNLRPRIFSGRRLARLKREWAPAISVMTDDVVAGWDALAGQTCTDAEVLPEDGLDNARGQIIAFAREPSDLAWLRDPWALDEILGLFVRHSPRIVVTLAGSSCRPGTSAGSLRADDLRAGYARITDIGALALTHRAAEQIGLNVRDIRQVLLGSLPASAARAPHDLIWRASLAPGARHPEALGMEGVVRGGYDHEWSNEVISRLAPASSANVAGRALGLFGMQHASAFQDTAIAKGPTGDVSAYLPNERIPVGMSMAGFGPTLLRADARGATPLLRTIDHRTGRRGIGVNPLPTGVTPERVLGFVADSPEPGSSPLDAPEHHGAMAMRLGWEWGPGEDPPWGDHLLRPLVDQRRVWRGSHGVTGTSVYETCPHRLERSGARVLGPVFAVWTTSAGAPAGARPIFPILRDRAVIGLSANAPHGPCSPLGFVASQAEPSMREVFTAQARDGSLLHSTVQADTNGRHLKSMPSLGFTTW